MQRETSPLFWLYLSAAVVSPFVLVASFIVITRERFHAPDWADWFGWLGSVAIGAYCVWRLPLPRPVRAVLVCVYVPSVGFLLVGFWLGFVGSRYGLWL